MDVQRQCNAAVILFFVVAVRFFGSAVASAELTCKKMDSCKCSYSSSQLIDLSPLAGNPRWLDQYDSQAINMYSYNPCKPFDEGTCKNVAVCQNTGINYYNLGSQESTEFNINPQTGVLSIVYYSTDSLGVKRTSQIVTECSPDGADSFIPLGETEPGSGYYLFTLSSRHCCPIDKPSTSDPDLFSTGTKIIFGLSGLAVLYLCLGMFLQGCVRHKTGRHIVPNYIFWSGLPSLVRDGCIIFFSCGKHSTYESL